MTFQEINIQRIATYPNSTSKFLWHMKSTACTLLIWPALPVIGLGANCTCMVKSVNSDYQATWSAAH